MLKYEMLYFIYLFTETKIIKNILVLVSLHSENLYEILV